MSMNRRDFLKGAATAGAIASAGMLAACSSSGVNEGGMGASQAGASDVLTEASREAPWSFEVAPDPIPEEDIVNEYTADVVVVGGGMSGMCCACSASEMGVDVIVVTASSRGISRGGSNNGINTAYQKEHGITYTEQDAMRVVKTEQFISTCSVDTRKWAKWVNHSGESIDWMCDVMKQQGLETSLEFGYEDPDGLTSCPASSHNFWNEEQPFGALYGAPLQAQAYARQIEAQGGTIHYNTVAEQLVRDDDNTGRVSAVIAKDAEGAYVRYNANKAVVLATGDFSKDRDMMAKYCPNAYEMFKDVITWDNVNYDDELVYTGLFPGQGHKMGLWVGAAWQRTYPNPPMMYVNSKWPSSGGVAGFLGINLGSDGKRFMNENTTMVFLANLLMQRPDQKIFMVWDTDFAYRKEVYNQFGTCVDYVNGTQPQKPEDIIASWEEDVSTGEYYKADSIDDLLSQMSEQGLNAENAKQSIEDWNRYCEQGYDEEFQDNPALLNPIAKAPFYGSFVDKTSLAFLTVMGGLRTNENLQVCEEDDAPIEGLYCVGTMIGDFYANQYTFTVFGQNLGACCCTLPYLLGRDLAEL